MLNSRFFRRLFLPYLLLVCATTAAVGLYGAARLRSGYLDGHRAALARERRSSGNSSVRIWIAAISLRFAIVSRDSPTGSTCRVTLIAADGTVIADNEADPTRMENHRTRPEVMDALGPDAVGGSIRHSATLNTDLFYFARRETLADGRVAFVRLAIPLAPLAHELNLLYLAMAIVAVGAMAIATMLCFVLARRQTEPVRELAAFADDLSRGNLNRRIIIPAGGEIGTLTKSLNTMADSLTGLIAQSTHDRAELAAILASMSEGVIATDQRQGILLANSKAGELLGFDARASVGRPLWEVVRIEPILKATAEVERGGEHRAFPVSPRVGRHLEVAVRRFGTSGSAGGLVIVAHDTTRSVRYDELRKEFIANVSHELRTPLTVIKGFTETLMDGALADPVRGPEFLATITKHLDQLTNLVADLLELSRLEGTPELPRPVSVDLGVLSRKAVDLILPEAQRKNQTLSIDVKGFIPRATGNSDYLERAVTNLIVNAVKYTHDGGAIAVTVSADEEQIFVEVADNGIGIPADDIPRIFERFYRVDRSRSREMGGTGLGLSIVKHVANVHGGGIDVASTPGVGSRFRLRLPVRVE